MNVIVMGVRGFVEEQVAFIPDVEDAYGSNRIYFNELQWRKVLYRMEKHGYTEEELRFFNAYNYKPLQLVAPHNKPRFMCQFIGFHEPIKTIPLEDAELMFRGGNR